MFVTKKHLSRRTLLRGGGAALALPLLDSMIPAATALAQTAATPKSRLGCIYIPHGATMDKWTPSTTGTGFEFTEILKPLEPFRERVNVISGLAHPYVAGAGGADVSAGANHTRAAAVFLTGAVPERGTQAHLGVSADQVAARHIGRETDPGSSAGTTASCGGGGSAGPRCDRSTTAAPARYPTARSTTPARTRRHRWRPTSRRARR